MKLGELIERCRLEVVVAGDGDRDVATAYASDLLSDAMANCPENSVFITVQNHKNSLAVATLVGAAAIVICRQRDIPEDMSQAAEREGVAILRTPGGQFETSVSVAKALGLC